MRNSWPDGIRRAMSPGEHDRWNASHYPGTLQLCSECGEPTSRCEEDAIYTDGGAGPLCPDCWNIVRLREK